MAAAIGMADFQQTALAVVAVEGGIAVRIDLLGDVALIVSLVLPGGFAAMNITDEPVAVFVRRRVHLPGE